MRNSDQKLKAFEKFSKKMTALIMVVSITPLMIATGVVVERYKVSYQAKTLSHLGELVQHNARMVDTFLQERLQNISFLTRLYSCRELSDPVFLNQRLKALQNEYGPVFQDMGFVNQDGLQVSYAGSYQLQNAQYADADWFKRALAKDNYISDNFMGLRGFSHCIVTVTKSCHGSRWVLRATIDFSTFSSMVENLRIGRTGCAFIVNKAGELQTRQPEAFKELQVQLPDSELQEIDFLRLTAPLKGGDWLLVIMQKRTDAFGDLKKTQKIAFGAFFVGLVASIITALCVPALIFSMLTEKR